MTFRVSAFVGHRRHHHHHRWKDDFQNNFSLPREGATTPVAAVSVCQFVSQGQGRKRGGKSRPEDFSSNSNQRIKLSSFSHMFAPIALTVCQQSLTGAANACFFLQVLRVAMADGCLAIFALAHRSSTFPSTTGGKILKRSTKTSKFSCPSRSFR